MRLERFVIAIALLSVIIATPLARAEAQANKTSHQPLKSVVKIVSPKKNTIKENPPVATQEPPQVPIDPPQHVIAPAVPISCEEAIRQVWPPELQQGAITVAVHESSLNASDIGPEMLDGSIGYNYDGSRDYGCFQINDKAHPDFFTNNDWSNPTANAVEGLKIYNDRGNWTAWYAVAGILY